MEPSTGRPDGFLSDATVANLETLRASRREGGGMNDEARWFSLAAAIRREMTAHFPDWVDTNDDDPGITLLNLFAWLTERLWETQSGAPPQRIAAARRLAAVASAWANAECNAEPGALLRVNYFDGKLLTADEFRVEQTYFRRRLRLLNQRLHGRGVVSGLRVSIEGKGNGARIEISPGVAIDPTGEEIVVADCVTRPLPSAPQELYLQIRWVERECMPEPATDGSEPKQYARIADTWETSLAPVAAQDAVTLAHLRRISGRWTIAKARAAGKARRGKRG